MRTLDQINEDIDAQLTTHEALSRREREQDMLGSTQDQRVELRAARRRNDVALLLLRQERWEFNTLRNLEAEAIGLFEAKLSHAAAYEAYGEAVREHKRSEYGPWSERAGTSLVQIATHQALCVAAQHLSNVRAAYEAQRESTAHALATGRALRAEGFVTRALAA